MEETDPIFSNSPAANITDANIENWNNKSDFDGQYTSLDKIPPLFPTNDIIIYDFSSCENNNLKNFASGYFSSTDYFNSNNNISIENKL
jgi:hypothetical protein